MIDLPPVGGFTEQLFLPQANAAVPLSIAVSTNPPQGLPAVQVRRRFSPNVTAPYLYFLIEAQAAVTLGGNFNMNVTAPSSAGVIASTLYLASIDPDGVWYTVMGPASQSGKEYEFGQPLEAQFAAGNVLVFALYSGSYLTDRAPLVADPNQVLLSPAQAQSMTVTGPNADAAVSISEGNCAGTATITNSRGYGSLTTTVIGVAYGSCELTISDNWGNQMTVPVSVTSATVIVN